LLHLFLYGQAAQANTLEELLSGADPFSTQPTRELETLVEALMPLENQASDAQKLRIDLFKMRYLAIRGKYAAALELLRQLDNPNIAPEYRVRAYSIAIPLLHIHGEYVQSFHFLGKMQQLLPWIENQDLLYIASSLVPELYLDAGDLDKALSFSNTSILAAKHTGKDINLCSAYDTLVDTYIRRDELKLAAGSARSMLNSCNAANAPLFSGMAAGALGLVLQKQGRHAEALERFQAALALTRETSYRYGIAFSLIGLAESHLALGQVEQAKAYLDRALPMLETYRVSQNHINAYTLKSRLEETQGNHKEALTWYRKKSVMEKQTMDNRKAVRIAQLQVAFEVKNKEQRIEQLQQENQLLALQKKTSQQRSLIITLGLVILALVAVLLWLKAQRERRHFKHMSQVDPLTGLYNHACCYSLAEKGFHECLRQNRPFTVVVADIDWFKYVNDTYGHAAGDKVLQHIASVLRECLGRKGIVGRTGGEEFTCFLPGTSLEQAYDLVENCRQQIHPVVDYNKSIEVTLSYGLAQSLGDYNTLDTLVRNADEALYRAKRNGRNQVLAHPPDNKVSKMR
jgi:diguanylate cyclase (GGDEF)-like protein